MTGWQLPWIRRPGVGTPKRGGGAVRAALLALDRPDGPFRVRDGAPHGVDVVAEAMIDGRIFRTTSLVLMKLDAQKRVVRNSHGIDIREVAFDGVVHDPEHGWFPSLRRPAQGRHRAATMRRELRHTVLQAGWTWRGVSFLPRRGGVRVPWIETNTPTLRLFGAVACALGVTFLLLGGASIASTAGLVTSSERTQGTVVELTAPGPLDPFLPSTRDWVAIVEFTVDGHQFTARGSTGRTPPETDTLPVEYDPADPSNAHLARDEPLRLGTLLFTVMGIGATAAGAVLLVTGRGAARTRAWLRQEGKEVWVPARVEIDNPVEPNRRHRYVVYAEWRDQSTGRTHTAKSVPLYDDPAPHLTGRTHVRVLYDPIDPDRNLVDLDAAP